AAEEQFMKSVGYLGRFADGGSQQLLSEEGVSLRTRLYALDQGRLSGSLEDGRQQLPHLDRGHGPHLDRRHVTAAFELAEHRPERVAPVEVVDPVGADQHGSRLRLRPRNMSRSLVEGSAQGRASSSRITGAGSPSRCRTPRTCSKRTG